MSVQDKWRPLKEAAEEGDRAVVLRRDVIEHDSLRIAADLRARGLGPGAVVAILAADPAAVLTLLVAARRTGLVGLPLDPSLTVEEMAYVVNDSGARAVFVGDEFVKFADAIRALTPEVEVRRAIDAEIDQHDSWLAATDSVLPLIEHDSAAGSRYYSILPHGRPVGIDLPDPMKDSRGQRQLTEIVGPLGVGPGTVFVTSSPVADPVVTLLMIATIESGGVVVVPTGPKAGDFLDAITEHRATVVHLTPPHAVAVANAESSDGTRQVPRPLHTAVLGTSTYATAVIKNLVERWGPCLRQVVRIDEDGCIYSTGTEAMLSPGEVLEARQVEHALMAHPAVADAAATQQDHGVYGSWLSVLVEPAAGQVPGVALHELLAAHVLGAVPNLEEPPRFLFTSRLPRTASGKLDRRRPVSRSNWAQSDGS